jgi:hypothetical protein
LKLHDFRSGIDKITVIRQVVHARIRRTVKIKLGKALTPPLTRPTDFSKRFEVILPPSSSSIVATDDMHVENGFVRVYQHQPSSTLEAEGR